MNTLLHIFRHMLQKYMFTALMLFVLPNHAMDEPFHNDLLEAIARCRLDEVRRCIRFGINVNAPREFDGLFWYPIHMAARAPSGIDMIRELLEHGASINQQTSGAPHGRQDHMYAGRTPLHFAVEGYPGPVTFLLARGAAVNARDRLQRTPLHYAVDASGGSNVYAGIVEELLDKGAQINALDFYGKTALHYVAETTFRNAPIDWATVYKIVELLIARGADMHARDQFKKWTPLQYAEEAGNRNIAKMLIEAEKMSAASKTAASPPEAKVEPQKNQLVPDQAQSAKNRQVPHPGNQPQPSFKSPGQIQFEQYQANIALFNAARDGSLPDFLAALQARAQVNSKHHHSLVAGAQPMNFTPLHIAAYNGHTQLVELLLAAHADVNVFTESGSSPLYCSIIKGHPEIVKMLCAAGSDVDKRAVNHPPTALELAYMTGNVLIMRILLRHGATIGELTLQQIFSDLEKAVIANNIDEVRRLIPSQTPVIVNDTLLVAVAQRREKIVEYLLHEGANKVSALERLKLIIKQPLNDQRRHDYELIRTLLETHVARDATNHSQIPRVNMPGQDQSARLKVVHQP